MFKKSKLTALALSLVIGAAPIMASCGTNDTSSTESDPSLTVAGRTVTLAVEATEGITPADNGDGTSSKTYDMSNKFKQYENVRFLGRNYTADYTMISDGTTLAGLTYFNWTASGFEIAFTGTELSVELVSNRYDQEDIYFYAAIDGKEAPDECTYIKVGGNEKASYVLATGLEDTNHIITLRRATRGCMGSFFDERSLGGKTALVSATVKGANPALLGKVADREMKLEFIGDSITCGDAISLTAEGKQIEDGYRTYAAQTARKLNADYNVMSISGNGVICSVLGSPLLDLPDQYLYTDNLSNGNEKWDFSKYQSDYVIVNLGTNDGAGVKAGTQDGTYGKFSFNEFKYGVERSFNATDKVEMHTGVWGFLNMIHENNPNAKIIWVYGAMGNSLATPLSEVITEWNTALGSTTAYYLEIVNDNTFENGLGQAHDGGHPSEYAGNVYSDQIVALINSIKQA